MVRPLRIWRAVTVRPGDRGGAPSDALRVALGLPVDAAEARVSEALARAGPTLIFVDQLEELYTQSTSPAQQEAFAAALAAAVSVKGGPIQVVMTLRHDFLPSHFEHGELHVRTIGHALMSSGKYGYILPFEVISLLLLACIVGGILIAFFSFGHILSMTRPGWDRSMDFDPTEVDPAEQGD